jgi:sec-independent protein translocase protein TatB
LFDIGWSEMAVIMLLALIVIGPKDLPRVARSVGQWVRKGRMLAREFQTSLEEMAREAELDDVKKEIEKVGRTDLKKTIEKTVDPKGELSKAFDVASGTPAGGQADRAVNGSAVEAPAAGTAKAETAAPAAQPAAAAKASPSAKKPASTARKNPPAAKKPAADKPSPRKPRAKTAAPAKSGGSDGPGDDAGGSAAMAAKPS